MGPPVTEEWSPDWRPAGALAPPIRGRVWSAKRWERSPCHPPLLGELSAIPAVTVGARGLVGSLPVGLTYSKSPSRRSGVGLIGVQHIEGTFTPSF